MKMPTPGLLEVKTDVMIDSDVVACLPAKRLG